MRIDGRKTNLGEDRGRQRGAPTEREEGRQAAGGGEQCAQWAMHTDGKGTGDNSEHHTQWATHADRKGAGDDDECHAQRARRERERKERGNVGKG